MTKEASVKVQKVIIFAFEIYIFLEFFTLVIAQIFKPDYGMFYLNHENDYYFFNRVQFQETEKEYMLIGMLIGLAIYNSIILDIAFPTVIFKKLSGELGEFQVRFYFHFYF